MGRDLRRIVGLVVRGWNIAISLAPHYRNGLMLALFADSQHVRLRTSDGSFSHRKVS